MFWPNWEQPEVDIPSIEIQDGQVTISCPTEGASIGYQVLNKEQEPGHAWQIYSKPFELGSDLKVVAVADRIGFKASKIGYN